MMKINAWNIGRTFCLLALLVLAQGPAWAARAEKKYTGIINYVDPSGCLLDMQGALFDKEFKLGPACACLLPNQGRGKISDLHAGENVTIQYQKTAGGLLADQVEQNLMRFAGMVDDVNSTNHTVTVYCHWLDRTFNLAPHCQIILRNNQPGGFTNLQNGSQVLVTYETPGGTPTAQQIRQTSILFTGTLKAVDPAAGTLKAKAGFGLKNFSAAKNCSILIHGRTAQLGDLRPGDKLVFSYDVIKGVNVVNQIVPEGEANDIVSIDEYKIDL